MSLPWVRWKTLWDRLSLSLIFTVTLQALCFHSTPPCTAQTPRTDTCSTAFSEPTRTREWGLRPPCGGGLRAQTPVGLARVPGFLRGWPGTPGALRVAGYGGAPSSVRTSAPSHAPLLVCLSGWRSLSHLSHLSHRVLGHPHPRGRGLVASSQLSAFLLSSVYLGEEKGKGHKVSPGHT